MNIYKEYSPEQREEMLSHFGINSWSYSKLMSFARNEKSFEASYLYGIYGRSSATTIAGTAYHAALQNYFENKKKGIEIDIVELQEVAYAHIDEVKANYWKIQKTTPTVEECRITAIELVNKLLANFIGEKSIYEEHIKDVIDVEVNGDEYVTVDGVDIQLPLHFKIDLVIRTHEYLIVIVDHKSVKSYTSEEEAEMSKGIQSATYVLGYEEKTGLKVDEVWFIENKASANKDKTSQLQSIKIAMNIHARRLYESLLYEPIRKMLQAVSDPDYIYLINFNDNFTDLAEICNFWARQKIGDIDDFNVDPEKKALLSKRLKKIKDSSIGNIPLSVVKAFQEKAAHFITYDLSTKDMSQAQKIEHSLRAFNIITRVAHEFDGYSSNTYLLEISAGVKISSIHSKRLDIANALDVNNVRISKELVVYEGKSYLAIDFSKKRDKDLFFDKDALKGVKIPLGKDNLGQTIIWDLENHSTPHMLVCGATGSGKSIFLESTIEYAKEAGIDNIVIFDPKYEFGRFNNNRNVLVFSDILEIEEKMEKLVEYMNELVESMKKSKTLVVFDEFADAVAQARSGNELKVYETMYDGNYANGSEKRRTVCTGELKALEENLRILLQKGRSSGFRIIAATQRASVKVIGGDAKVNFPVQICFKVPKAVDSKVVLDEEGAESLAGKGDGLIKSPEYNDTIRFQAFYKPQNVTA